MELPNQQKLNNLQERLFNFAINIIKRVRKLPKGKDYAVISYQLIKAATSVGANYEESQSAVSKADFSNKIAISLKEVRESNYWIRIIIAITENNSEWVPMQKESFELMTDVTQKNR